MTASEQYQAERREANVLIDKGVKFTTKKVSFLKYFSKKKDRTFVIQQPFLGTLDILSELFLSIEFDEQSIQDNPLSASKELIQKSAKKCALVVAVAVLNSKLGIKFFSKILANYFLWRIKPSDLINIAFIVNQVNNYGDFTNSIRLMSVIRMTTPNRIEKAD